MADPQVLLDDEGSRDIDRRLRDAGAQFRAASNQLLETAASRPVDPAARARTPGHAPVTLGQRRERQRRRAHRQRIWVSVGATAGVLVIVGVMVLVSALRGESSGPAPAAGVSVSASARPPALRDPAPRQLVEDATRIPAAAFAEVGEGTTTGRPELIKGAPALTANGKPLVFSYGAEFCPYCAAERWAVVAALSRFGTWSNLSTTTSASEDVFPSTPTFSFYGAQFTSPYLSFKAVETTTNQRSGNGYQRLETPTAAENALVAKYDIINGQAGSIPFVDFGNKYKISGATYDPQVLQGKSLDEIAASIPDPSTDVGKSVLGAANQITAAVCNITDGKPGNVCDAPHIRNLRTQLDATG